MLPAIIRVIYTFRKKLLDAEFSFVGDQCSGGDNLWNFLQDGPPIVFNAFGEVPLAPQTDGTDITN